jgi:hypothetical protein
MTLITLTREEVRVCSQIALERWLTKQTSKDRPNYASGKEAGKLEHDLLAGIRANVSEYAVAKHLNVAWSFPWYPNEDHPKRKDLPDVGTRTEVRTVRTRNEIPVWSKDVEKQAVIVGTKILDPDYFTKVEIYGLIAASAATRNDWWSPEINGWRVPITELTRI